MKFCEAALKFNIITLADAVNTLGRGQLKKNLG